MGRVAKANYEHFRKLVLETDRYLYYINSLGYFERVDKRTIVDFVNTTGIVFQRINQFVFTDKNKYSAVYSAIEGKRYLIRSAIIRFIKNYELKSDECIIHLDGNPHNCNVENLQVIKRGVRPDPQWKKWKLTINDKEEIIENTRRLCKRLGIDRITFYRYRKGRYSSNYWLNDYKIERIE